MNGLLLIDKPAGWTSFDVVAKVRGMIRAQSDVAKPKVGHTGTLDPLATGLLILTVGTYCKRAQQYSGLDKTYEAIIELGSNSSTDDAEGEQTVVSNRQPSEAEIAASLQQFQGVSRQLPPQFSAKKVAGQRAYKAARSGKTVALQPQTIQVYEIDLQAYRYPQVRATMRVSSGTYIRAIARDIGARLQTGAYLSGLRRTTIGPYTIEQATPMADLQRIEDRIIHVE